MIWMIFLAMLTENTNYMDKFGTDTFRTSEGRELKITFIKHASLLFTYDGKSIYIDPVSDYADYSRFPSADFILITHSHPDHLDTKAIAQIEKTDTRIVADADVCSRLGKGEVMKNGDRLYLFPGLEIEAVPAYNTTPGREIYHPKNRDNGYLLTVGGIRIYIAGDTEDIPEMERLKNVDIAFLPVNQPYTMTVAQAIHAARMVKPAVLYPYHYGNTDLSDLQKALADNTGIEVRIRQLQ